MDVDSVNRVVALSVSTVARRSMFAASTGDGLLELVTLSGGGLAADIPIVNNRIDITSRGVIFTAFPFELSLPSDEEDSPPLAKLSIDNVSREIGQAVRLLTGPLHVLIELVRISDMDVVEWSWPYFLMRNVSIDSLIVSGDLSLQDFHREGHTKILFNPATFPAMF